MERIDTTAGLQATIDQQRALLRMRVEEVGELRALLTRAFRADQYGIAMPNGLKNEISRALKR